MVEFPILADTKHAYNQEEYQLYRLYPIIGYNEVLNNTLVPIVSKKIILLQNVWENYDASYDTNKKIFSSYPISYEDKFITKENKDICVNILQAANLFDIYMIRDIPQAAYKSNITQSKENFVYNAKNMFSKEVYDLMNKCFLCF